MGWGLDATRKPLKKAGPSRPHNAACGRPSGWTSSSCRLPDLVVPAVPVVPGMGVGEPDTTALRAVASGRGVLEFDPKLSQRRCKATKSSREHAGSRRPGLAPLRLLVGERPSAASSSVAVPSQAGCFSMSRWSGGNSGWSSSVARSAEPWLVSSACAKEPSGHPSVCSTAVPRTAMSAIRGSVGSSTRSRRASAPASVSSSAPRIRGAASSKVSQNSCSVRRSASCSGGSSNTTARPRRSARFMKPMPLSSSGRVASKRPRPRRCRAAVSGSRRR